ncbi:hypothetical protein FN846DRAFT_604223 [Sphaerosporella brunnea]|uniref:Uncharacterized protein n=1 Tax=Sphaerosporella brunnea TaxID=1250544 RepID=A0A5J5F1A1_9PEZI|nr:hypothetical protein FN846DRAFT_604223 [Sphaerosporella brunnea]
MSKCIFHQCNPCHPPTTAAPSYHPRYVSRSLTSSCPPSLSNFSYLFSVCVSVCTPLQVEHLFLFPFCPDPRPRSPSFLPLLRIHTTPPPPKRPIQHPRHASAVCTVVCVCVYVCVRLLCVIVSPHFPIPTNKYVGPVKSAKKNQGHLARHLRPGFLDITSHHRASSLWVFPNRNRIANLSTCAPTIVRESVFRHMQRGFDTIERDRTGVKHNSGFGQYISVRLYGKKNSTSIVPPTVYWGGIVIFLRVAAGISRKPIPGGKGIIVFFGMCFRHSYSTVLSFSRQKCHNVVRVGVCLGLWQGKGGGGAWRKGGTLTHTLKTLDARLCFHFLTRPGFTHKTSTLLDPLLTGMLLDISQL